MAPPWQAWPIHRTAEVHATSRCRAPSSRFLCSVSAIAHCKPWSHGSKEPGQRSGVGSPEQSRVELFAEVEPKHKIARSLIPRLTDIVEAVERVNGVLTNVPSSQTAWVV